MSASVYSLAAGRASQRQLLRELEERGRRIRELEAAVTALRRQLEASYGERLRLMEQLEEATT
jgi:hypothetical protein